MGFDMTETMLVVLFVWQSATTLGLVTMCVMLACRRRKRTHPKHHRHGDSSHQNGHVEKHNGDFHGGASPIKKKKRSPTEKYRESESMN